jgi:nitrite reductase/ring-hydroxylating ferredoxin subunit
MKWYKLFDSYDEACKKLPFNTPKLLVAGGRKICIGRNARGIFAIDDACPHYGASFSQGTLNDQNEIICPWHSYCYSLRTGEEEKHMTEPAILHLIDIRTDGVFVGVEDES